MKNSKKIDFEAIPHQINFNTLLLSGTKTTILKYQKDLEASPQSQNLRNNK
jgi:hypothetical protein